METLHPQQFLRVNDKFFPGYILRDKAVSQAATLAYIALYESCLDAKADTCSIPQKELAELCKCGVRTVQHSLQLLISLSYIRTERNQRGGGLLYTLLLSPRLQALLNQHKIELADSSRLNSRSASPAQNLREGGAKSAPLLNKDQRDQRKLKTPLPPISGTAKSSAPQTASRGGGFSSPKPVKPKSTYADFQRLWDVWPVSSRQNRAGAMRLFQRLALGGQLPPTDKLLDSVKLFSDQDDRWRRGYAPNLVNWLRDRRWEDEVRSLPGAEPALSPEERKAEEARRLASEKIEKERIERLATERLNQHSTGGMLETLKSLRPDIPVGKLVCSLYSDHLRYMSLDAAEKFLNEKFPKDIYGTA